MDPITSLAAADSGDRRAWAATGTIKSGQRMTETPTSGTGTRKFATTSAVKHTSAKSKKK